MAEKRGRSRSAAKRAAILEAATAAFRSEGYETTSMDRVAELANVSKRTVYNHFGSKEALFQAVLDLLHEKLDALKRVNWDPNRSLEAQLGEFARAKARVGEDEDMLGLVRVVLGVFIHNPELAKETLRRSAAGENHLVRWLKAAHRAGRLRVPSPGRAAELFWSMVGGALFWPQILTGPLDAKERRRLTKDVIETYLCRYRADE